MKDLWERFCRARSEVGIVGVFRQAVRNYNPIQKCVLFKAPTDDVTMPVKGDGDLKINRYSAWTEIPERLQLALFAQGGEPLRIQFNDLFSADSTIWIGELDDQLAGVCWNTQPRERRNYFVPLTANDTTIYSCFTVPAYRGRNVYPRMLVHVIDQLHSASMISIYIDCKCWNQASIRGIKKAGFRYVGYSWRVVCGGKVWYFWDNC